MTSPPFQQNNMARSGFTMIELLAVMGIIALMIAFGVMALGGSTRGAALRSAAVELRSNIMLARQYAMAHNTPTSVVFAHDPRISMGGAGTAEMDKIYLNSDRLRYLRAYALYSEKDGYLSEWKFLPQGVIFDPDRTNAGGAATADQRNILRNEDGRFARQIQYFSGNNNNATPTTVWMITLNFRPDGSVMFENDYQPTGEWEIFVTEGTTNAEEGIASKAPLEFYFKDQNKTGSQEKRLAYSVAVTAMVGGFRVREFGEP